MADHSAKSLHLFSRNALHDYPGELRRALKDLASTSKCGGREPYHVTEATFAFWGLSPRYSASGQPKRAIVPRCAFSPLALIRPSASRRAQMGAYAQTVACCDAIAVLARSLMRKMSLRCREFARAADRAWIAQKSGREPVISGRNSPNTHRQTLVSSNDEGRCRDAHTAAVVRMGLSDPVKWSGIYLTETSFAGDASAPA